VIAYFSFRKGCPSLVSAPIIKVFGTNGVTRIVGWLSDLSAIVAIAIGVGGSVAMGVFQVKEGVDALFGLQDTGMGLTLGIFVVLCISFIFPLTVDLSRGMALLSNAAMAIAGGLMIFILLTGPTYFIMGGIVQAAGEYLAGAFTHGFRTFTLWTIRSSTGSSLGRLLTWSGGSPGRPSSACSSPESQRGARSVSLSAG
jgi:glycine betaine transporter